MANRKGGPTSRKGTPADFQYFDLLIGRRKRPNGLVPISAHRECGLLLHLVARATVGRPGAAEPVKFVINTLDALTMQEYSEHELDGETLAGLYCPGPKFKIDQLVDLNELTDLLDRVKCILVAHYPNGSALRGLLLELDRAAGSIRKWDGKPRGKVYREPSKHRERLGFGSEAEGLGC